MGRREQVSTVEEIARVQVMTTGMESRVCELETENTRLRLLVSELLVANQRLRERGTAVWNQVPSA